jgi:tetratricopeptide (TPR) repeat protein
MNLSPQAQRGRVFLEQGRFPEAEKYFRESLAEEPNDPASLYFLAVCQARQDRQKEALVTIDRSLALEPEAGDFHAFRGLLLTDLGRPADATKAVDEALRLEPDSDFAWSSQASVFLSQKQWAKAEVSARKALDLNPDNASAANQLAHALRLQNRLQESSDQTAYMLGQNPEDPDTRITAGWTDLQRGDHKSAEAHFLEALRLDAGNEAAREGLKEAFRARSPLYRAYLNYCFFLQRFTSGKQWLIIIGLIFAVNFADKVLPGPLALLVVVLYFLFVLWAHVARAVGNLQLSFDKFARHALNTPEKIEAWVVGGGVVAGLPLFLAGLGLDIPPLFIVGLTLIAISFPFAYTFTNKAPVGRLLFGLTGLYVLMVGFLNAAVALKYLPESPVLSAATLAAWIAVMLVTWLANVRALNRR